MLGHNFNKFMAEKKRCAIVILPTQSKTFEINALLTAEQIQRIEKLLPSK